MSGNGHLLSYFYKYVIFASSFLSALFHDMGYPICHFLEVRHRISEYNPTFYMFTHNAIESFDQLASKLEGSLLFSIVSAREIKERLQKINDSGKYDHGAYSAIAFLLQFYETGIIYSLSAEKQCAIEMAAVAIYNHTAKYNCVKYKKENNYYQPNKILTVDLLPGELMVKNHKNNALYLRKGLTPYTKLRKYLFRTHFT